MSIINKPKEYFDNLGNLHDARIESLHWMSEEKRLSISIDDLNSSFEGLPEYKGHKPGTIILEGVSEIEIGISPVESHLNIHEFTVEVVAGDLCSTEIKCWPGGKVAVKCSSLHITENKNE